MGDVYDDNMEANRVEFNENEHSPEEVLCVMCGGLHGVYEECPCMTEDLDLG